MTPERKKSLVEEIAVTLGAVRAWRLVILSILGLVLVLAAGGILVGVYVDGAATLDDIGLPAAFVAVLGPVLAAGLLVGISRVRALGKHELLLALQASPPAIARIERVVHGSFVGIGFHLPSGARYTIWLSPQSVQDLESWLAR